MIEDQLLTPDAIIARLHTSEIGRKIVVFRETSSTNDRIRQAGIGGEAQGLVIFAESQTAGRGTHGRTWISAPGSGLWFSVLLRTRLSPVKWPLLVQMAAVATAEALQSFMSRSVQIKSPNDLVVESAKLAGFLLETSNRWDFQVLGIGINVRSSPPIPEYPTASVDQYSAGPVARAELAAAILNRFEEWYLHSTESELAKAYSHWTL
jgi:BirA family transcriptional regulator, biotin operon repressor / biotin---[acetyl-CoA-carboxylase] ligase